MSSNYNTLADIDILRNKGWTWTEIGATYSASERQVRRWVDEQEAPSLPPPVDVNYDTAFVINDTQYPYHDPALWEVACQIARDTNPDTIIWAGDMIDFPQLGTYKHDPYRLRSADQDVEGFHDDIRLPLLEAVKGEPRELWANGNHEDRYKRYREKNEQPAGRGILPHIKEFLRLPEEVDYVDWGKCSGHLLTPKLLIAHGWYARKWSAYTAKAHSVEVGDISVLTGHTHRIGQFAHTTRSGTQVAYENGHMCDPDATPKATAGYQNWQQVAGARIRYERGGDAFDVELIPVFGPKRDRCIAGNREYRISR